MTRTSLASRFVAPAGLALAALMLVASPVGFGKTGLALQQARADTSVDPINHETTSQDTNSNDSSSGTDHSSSGNAGTNGGSHDSSGGSDGSNGGSNGGSGGSKDGGADR